MIVTIFVSVLVSYVIAGEDVKDGMMYQLTSSLDDNVLTITSPDMDSGSNVTLQPWLDQSSQKFLTVSMKQGDGENERYLLVPRHQKFDWSKFVAQGSGSLKDRRGDLTNQTLVLAADVKGKEKFVTQQLKNEKTAQQWQFTKVGSSGKYLIKNVDNDLCLKNPGVAKKKGIMGKIKGVAGSVLHHGKKTPKYVAVHMDGCNRDEAGQQWILESHS